MRTTLAFAPDPTEWLTVLLRKLQPWALATGVLVGAAGGPATDTLGLVKGSGYIAQLANGDGSTLNAELPFSPEEQRKLYRTAQSEAGRAQAVLQELRMHLGLSEVKGYVDAIGEVLDATPDMKSLDQAQAFTLGLQAARSRLLEDTASLPLWLKIAHLMRPEEEEHRVPERFVVRETEDVAEEPLVFSRSNVKARRLVESFLGDDADTSTGQS